MHMLDADVRRAIYDLIIRHGAVPTAARVATELGMSEDEVRQAFRRLAAQRIVVLDGDDIVMAAPFSGVPTDFIARTAQKTYFVNCIWDALGVSPMLKVDSVVETYCDDCDTAMRLIVSERRVEGEGVVHFAVPTRAWWQDIVFT